MPTEILSRELTDSLLHTNMKRVIVGVICGLVAGVAMLGLTLVVVPQGALKVWWLQLLASICYRGNAFADDAPQQVLMLGAAIHFAIAALLGFIMGKATRTSSVTQLASYGLVLGGLCWLASNMFGPDFLYPQALWSVGQWLRVLLFVFFNITLGLLLAAASRALRL